MSELPRPLERWSEALALFPPHLALELGAWLPRLHAALGPLRALLGAGSDEPDGFDGLSRRGPYERLLPAEWALADEHPDEFARRASGGEHAFYQLAFHAPAGQRRCLALLDCGPWQLGTPRLAHLAALLVLERRATEARTELGWGVLQELPGRFLTGLTAAAVEHWRHARTALEASPEQLAGWRAACGQLGPHDELWVLGGRRTGRCQGAGRMVVAEAPGALVVELEPHAGPRREVRLPLPADEVCTQLVRDPLRRHAPLGRAGGVATNLCFTAGGSRLLYGAPDGTLVTHLVPAAPSLGTRPEVWTPPPDEQVVAAAWDKGLTVITSSRGHLRLSAFGKRGHLRSQGVWRAPDGHPPVRHDPKVLGPAVRAAAWHVVTSHGELAVLSPDGTYTVQARGVVATPLHRRRLLTVARSDGDAHLAAVPAAAGAAVRFPAPGRAVPPAPRAQVKIQLFPAAKERVTGVFEELAAEAGLVTVRGIPPDAPVVFGFDTLAEHSVAVGLKLADGRWRVVRLRKHVDCSDLMVPADARVYGAACTELDDLPALVALEADRCGIVLCTGREVRRVVRSAAPVVQLVVSPYTSHLAYLDEGGLLCVYSLRRKQVGLRVLTGGPR